MIGSNSASPDASPELGPVEAAAISLGLKLAMYYAATPKEIDDAFTNMVERKPDAILVGTDSFLLSRRDDIVAWTFRLKVPVIYPFRDFAEAGGLMSYGTNIPATFRQAGIYVGRILKGDKPGDLPVMQPSVFELVIKSKPPRPSGSIFPLRSMPSPMM